MKRTQKLIRLLGLLWASVAFSATTNSTAQSVWTAAGNGDWGNTLNWSSGVPTIANAAILSNAVSKVITIDLSTALANRAARRMDLSAPAGSTNTLRLADLGVTPFQLANSFNLDNGSRLELINSFLQLDGSDGGNLNQFAGEIVLLSGGIATTNVAVPATNGLPGFRIGRSGIGRAIVLGGNLVAFDELVVGDLAGALGTLTLSNGLVHAGGVLNLANNAGAIGRFDVFGGSVIATNATARIGDDGDGALTLFGGFVQMDGASVARASNSVGRLVMRGGTMQPGSVSLGRFATAQGTLEVSGGTLDMSTKTLYVGREGAGTAIFSNGVALVETLIIAASNTASGTLQLRGGSLTTGQLIADKPAAGIQFSSGTLVVTQATTVANGAAFTVGNGTQAATLQLDGGTHSFANGLVLSSNATLKGTGTVIGNITILAGGSNQLGAASPPSVTLTPSLVNSQFHVSFPSTTGKLYDILTTTNLAAPDWQLQTTLTGTGALLTYTNNSTAGLRIFRVWIH